MFTGRTPAPAAEKPVQFQTSTGMGAGRALTAMSAAEAKVLVAISAAAAATVVLMLIQTPQNVDATERIQTRRSTGPAPNLIGGSESRYCAKDTAWEQIS